MTSSIAAEAPSTVAAPGSRTVQFEIYRYDPDKDSKPYMQKLQVTLQPSDRMLLDALIRIKSEVDDSLSLRRSCREGVCGSDAMNINGKNGLACVTNVRDLKEPIVLRPLPGLPVIRDLIVDMSQFFKQYHSIRPYVVNDTPPPEQERESIEAPKFVSGCRAPDVPPAMMANAATIRIEVEMMIDETGKIVAAKVVQSNPLIPDDVVLACANTQQFEPAHLPDGTAIPYPFRRRFVFKPAQA